jgi:hypothetical protein
LIEMAWENEAYAAWAAFAKHVPTLEGQTAHGILCRMAMRQDTEVYSTFWFRRSVPDVTDDELKTLMMRQDSNPEQEYAFRPLMTAEAERRKESRIRVRVLFKRVAKERDFPQDVVEKIITMARSGFRF